MAETQLRYKGTSDVREVGASDLKQHGDFEGFTKTTWSRDNNFVAVVPPDVAAKLVELHGDDFEIVDDRASASGEGDDSQSSSGKSKSK